MILGIISLVLVTALTVMQLFEKKRYVQYIAGAIGFIIIVLGFVDFYQRDKEKEFVISSLERIGTTINWKDSDTRLELMNKSQKVNLNGVRVDMKLYSYRQTLLPVAAISLRDAKLRSKLDEKWGYYFLEEKDAASLFNAFAEPDGSIYLDKEKAQAIQNLMYVGSSVRDGAFQGSSVDLKMQYGPVPAPTHAAHPFRFMSPTCSGVCRPLIPPACRPLFC
jgi:hypothetical protein